ncbi:MAG: hypothetical protein TREMPRED_001641 [Tremellales sp. Tagirdzhanova-0007]|nr:MAG: hypothetical protein TREMPRED_001641 [Tremellales sp. Tagirdzhanova-0007]
MSSVASTHNVLDTLNEAFQKALIHKKTDKLSGKLLRHHRSFVVLSLDKLTAKNLVETSDVLKISIGECSSSVVKGSLGTSWGITGKEISELDQLGIDCAELEPALRCVMSDYNKVVDSGEWRPIKSSEGSMTLSIDAEPRNMDIQHIPLVTTESGAAKRIRLFELTITKLSPATEVNTDPSITENESSEATSQTKKTEMAQGTKRGSEYPNTDEDDVSKLRKKQKVRSVERSVPGAIAEVKHEPAA